MSARINKHNRNQDICTKTKLKMKPLTDDEETHSFLPPTSEVRVPSSRKMKRSRTRNKPDTYLDDDQDSFCQTWMIKSIVKMLIVFFTTIAGIHFGRSLPTFMPHIHVTEWNGLQLNDIQNWCLDVSSNSRVLVAILTVNIQRLLTFFFSERFR